MGGAGFDCGGGLGVTVVLLTLVGFAGMIVVPAPLVFLEVGVLHFVLGVDSESEWGWELVDNLH